MGQGLCNERDPFFRWEDHREPQALRTLRNPGHTVELGVSVLAGLPTGGTIAAYHTSVVVDGVEYSFDLGGVTKAKDLASHKRDPDLKPYLVDMGLTPYTGAELVKALGHHFKEGSYDLLRKNCNSFSDCALWFLLERRLDVSYRGLEQVGAVADSNAGLVQYLSGSRYMPNPAADSFDLERTVCMVDTEKRLAAETEEYNSP